MIAQPTPQQYALVAQLLQQAVPGQVPEGAAPMRVPGVNPIVEGGFLRAPTDPVSRPDGGYNWGRRAFDHGTAPIGIPDKPGPFLQHAQALTAATRSTLHSHQQALIQKFMAAAQANAAKGVRK